MEQLRLEAERQDKIKRLELKRQEKEAADRAERQQRVTRIRSVLLARLL